MFITTPKFLSTYISFVLYLSSDADNLSVERSMANIMKVNSSAVVTCMGLTKIYQTGIVALSSPIATRLIRILFLTWIAVVLFSISPIFTISLLQFTFWVLL